MTFDEFKKHFETFSKIDSAEKLAICEKQYQRHLQHIEDENYFEPAENKNDDDLTAKYERNLNQILTAGSNTERSFSFLVRPSFAPEQLLAIKNIEEKYFLTLIVLAENYWAVFYANNKIEDIDKRITKSELSNEIGDILFTLLDKTITEAREAKAKSIILDGIIYSLTKYSHNKTATVYKHSPDSNSRSGKLIAIMEKLIKYVEQPDNKVLFQLKNEIENLLG